MGKDNQLEAVMAAAKAIDDKFGRDIRILDITELSALSDYFIITTAGSQNQIKAICNEAEQVLRKHGINMIHAEGQNTGGWVLLDFGTIIIHVFGKEERGFYNLERLWGDAKEIAFATHGQ